MNKKILKGIIAATILFFVANCNTVVSAAATDVVNIPDAGLKACLNSYFVESDSGMPVDPASDLVQADLALFVGSSAGPIDCTNYNISNLEGAQYLVNVEYLELSSNNISNVSPLGSLTKLKSLGLNDNSISNVSALSSLTNLSKLTLRNNNISDVSALGGLSNVAYLALAGNNISDISALSSMSNLSNLYLNENSIMDVSSLQGLTKLSRVDISNQTITNNSIYSTLETYLLPDVIDNSGAVVMYAEENSYILSEDLPTVATNNWNTTLAMGNATAVFSGTISHTITFGEAPVEPETPVVTPETPVVTPEVPVNYDTLPKTGFAGGASASLMAFIGLVVSKKLFNR